MPSKSDPFEPDLHRVTDEQVSHRTLELLKAAETISLELTIQTEKLAAAIELFNIKIVEPLRQGATTGDRTQPAPDIPDVPADI